MYPQGAVQHSDALLSPFLHATSEAESESVLTRLLAEQAGPVIKGIIRSKLHASGAVDDRLRWQDAEDVYGEVITQLLARLRACKTSPGSDAIGNFRNYVAVTTYNACYHHLRRKYPQRWRLKNRVRYLLTHRPELTLWASADGDWLCGFAAWRAQGRDSPAGAGRLRQLRDAPETLALAGSEYEDIRRVSLADLVSTILRRVAAPVELDALVNTVADVQGIKDLPIATNPDEGEASAGPAEPPTDLRSNVAADVERRSYLQRLWSEIVRLPLGQRAALLLNLRDVQEGVIVLLPLTGVATIRQIADAVAIPAEEFARLWNDLPLDDAAVAVRLGVTRQQVINLRKSARARLARRMRSLERTRRIDSRDGNIAGRFTS
jgi:DNA-directed RNA polymerase specialized sigma24 family protein